MADHRADCGACPRAHGLTKTGRLAACLGPQGLRTCSCAAGAQPQQGAANNAANWYNGWSSFAKMKNREPPLVMAYSCPLKCKLTPEVGGLLHVLDDDVTGIPCVPVS